MSNIDWSRVPPEGKQYDTLFIDAAGRFGFEPEDLVAIAHRESRFDFRARGSYGSRLTPPQPHLDEIGGMQNLPDPKMLKAFSTWLGKTITAVDLWDPWINILYAAWLLSLKRALATGATALDRRRDTYRRYYSDLPKSRVDDDYARDVTALVNYYTGGRDMDAFLPILQEEFKDQMDDLRWKLIRQGDSYGPIIPAQIVGVAVHNTGWNTTPETTWQQVAVYHVQTNGWNGIGYHIGIRKGRVAYLRDVTERGAHVKARNHELIGLVFAGYFEAGGSPSDEDLDLGRRLIACLDRFLGRKVTVGPHGDWQAGGKDCPGPALRQWCKTVRELPSQPEAGPVVGATRGAAVLTLNRGAALQRRIAADGFWAVSGEVPVDVSGRGFVGQLAEHPSTGERRVYYVERGEWERVLWAAA